MGNYYAGVMNSDYDSELKHFGILGQKWGVRRYQNPDGTLTPAGRERYGYSDVSDKEREKIKKMINDRPRNVDKIIKYPAIANAAKVLSSKSKPLKEANDNYEKIRDDVYKHVYGDERNYEKWLNKAVDHYIKAYPEEQNQRDDIKRWYEYDDGDQGEYGIFETYTRESNEPLAKKYNETEEKLNKLHSELQSEADKIANKILGDDADEMDRFWVSVFIKDAVSKF